jgi:hypothetical protein
MEPGRYLGTYTAFSLASGRVWELRQAHPALESNTPICVWDRCLQPHVYLREPWPPCPGELLLAHPGPMLSPLVTAFQGPDGRMGLSPSPVTSKSCDLG